jgi:hypothetical protein
MAPSRQSGDGHPVRNTGFSHDTFFYLLPEFAASCRTGSGRPFLPGARPAQFRVCGLFYLFSICIVDIMPIRQIDHPFIPFHFHWRLRQILPCSVYKAQITVSLNRV